MKAKLDFGEKVMVMRHPLIQHKLTLLRDKNTGKRDARDLVKEIAMLICYEATRNLPLELVEVETPICKTQSWMLAGKKLAIVPIWRAGDPMSDAIQSLIPAAKVGSIGMYRDEETARPKVYFSKMPEDCSEREILVCDPMLATGGSVVAAITLLKEKYACQKIRFLCLFAVPEGIRAIQKVHPEVEMYIGVVDERLNEKKYIVPGMGDAGDRIYGTK